jgi:hypothetical protein
MDDSSPFRTDPDAYHMVLSRLLLGQPLTYKTPYDNMAPSDAVQQWYQNMTGSDAQRPALPTVGLGRLY